MRFAAIADIHGNCAALRAVLNDIASIGIRDIVNLGDCFSGPLEADRTGDLLLLLDMHVVQTVRGNHDRYLMETPTEVLAPSDAHAHAQLAERHFDWLRKLPFSMDPGSVGCPAYDDDRPFVHKVETGHCMASYVVIEKTASGWVPQFRNVPYDHMAMSRLAAENGRLDWATALATGRVG